MRLAVIVTSTVVMLLMWQSIDGNFREFLDFFVNIILVGGTLAAVYVATKALELSKNTSDKQLELMEMEWKPHLSIADIMPIVDGEESGVTVSFDMQLNNVGKSVLRYEVIRFHVNFGNHDVSGGCENDDAKLVTSGYSSGVIGVNSSGLFEGAGHRIEPHIFDTTQDQGSSRRVRLSTIIKCDIDVRIVYWRADNIGMKHVLDQSMDFICLNGDWKKSIRETDYREVRHVDEIT